MGKCKQNVCPGCSRHCPLDHVRCKYGQKHLEKMQKARAADDIRAQKTIGEKRRRKWETHVTPNGPIWKLLWSASRLKRALRKKKLTEQQVLSMLSSEEQVRLNALLMKITKNLE